MGCPSTSSLAALDLLWGHRADQRAPVTARATSAGFLQFLERVVAACPTAPAIAILLDNVAIHCCQAVTRSLEEHPRSSSSSALAPAPITTRWNRSGGR